MSSRRRLRLSLALSLGAAALAAAAPAHAASIGYTGPDGVRIGPAEPRNPNGPTGRLCLVDKPCRDLYAPETCFDWANKHEKWFGACYFLDGYQVVWTPTFPPIVQVGYSRGLSVAGKEVDKLEIGFSEAAGCAAEGTVCRPLPAGTLSPEVADTELLDADGKVTAVVGETDFQRLVPTEGDAAAQCPPVAP